MIRGLLRPGVKVRWCGVDAKGLPVVQFKDKRRTTEPFAVPRMPRPSASVPVTQPVRALNDDDFDVIDEGSHLLICRMQRTPL